MSRTSRVSPIASLWLNQLLAVDQRGGLLAFLKLLLDRLDPSSGLLDLGRKHDKQATHTLKISLNPFGFVVGIHISAELRPKGCFPIPCV